jgi:hypothetical protein
MLLASAGVALAMTRMSDLNDFARIVNVQSHRRHGARRPGLEGCLGIGDSGGMRDDTRLWHLVFKRSNYPEIFALL